MWLIVNTDVFKEQLSIDLLREKYPDIIVDVYFPLSRKEYMNANGEKKARFQPLILGMFFIKVKTPRRLQPILSPYGYFTYRGVDYDPATCTYVERTFFSKAHLLCPNCKDKSVSEIIDHAIIPEEDMQRFVYYNERIADGIEGLSVVDKRYGELVLENDTIRLLNGPMAGWVGVVRQVKRGGKKDRHLFVRFGDNLCLNISNIRQYDMQIVHEATKGAKSEAVGVWRAIDQLIGYLQRRHPEENASAMLRKLLKDYYAQRQVYRSRGLSAVAYEKKKARSEKAHQEEVLRHIDPAMHGNFRILASFFHADSSTIDRGLIDIVPDVVLRPFLTPASGMELPAGADHVAFVHNGIVELVVRCNLRAFFRDKDYDAERYAPVFDEDYEYYAHVALLPTADGRTKAVVSWGGFYDSYESQNVEERYQFLHDLEQRHYPRLLRLLTGVGNVNFDRTNGIGGFSVCLDLPYSMDHLPSMTDEAFSLLTSPTHQSDSFLSLTTAAAVEMWQGTRLLVWRRLLQRYVLLHKVPVADLPMVIPTDPDFEQAFALFNGVPDIPLISAALQGRAAHIESLLRTGELAQATLSFLSTSKVLSFHFAKDDHHNYVSSAYAPDHTLSRLHAAISNALGDNSDTSHTAQHRRRLLDCLRKATAELKAMDSWRYFKFPSWLKEQR